MAKYDFKLPDIGEGVVEGEVVTWHVSVGDSVSEDDPIVDVMTDKATVTIPSPTDGTVLSLNGDCLLYTSPSPRDRTRSRMPSSA